MKLSVAAIALLSTVAPIFASAKDLHTNNNGKYLRALTKNEVNSNTKTIGEVSSSAVNANRITSSAGLRSLESEPTIAELALVTSELSVLVDILPDDLIDALSESKELTVSASPLSFVRECEIQCRISYMTSPHALLVSCLIPDS